jgi:DNA-binding protein HU-beta
MSVVAKGGHHRSSLPRSPGKLDPMVVGQAFTGRMRFFRARQRPVPVSPEHALSACYKPISRLWDARNPQFSDPDHEKTPNFREESMVRAAPNRLCDGCQSRFPTQANEEVSPMAKAAASGKQATVTLKNLAAKLSEDHEMSKKQTEAVLGDLVTQITKHLKKGDRIRIGGLGILQVRKRAARMGRNPATGEAIQIKASKKVAFRAAKELKESV